MGNRSLRKTTSNTILLLGGAFFILALSLFLFSAYMSDHILRHEEEGLDKTSRYLRTVVEQGLSDARNALLPVAGFAGGSLDWDSDPGLLRLLHEAWLRTDATGVFLLDEEGDRIGAGLPPAPEQLSDLARRVYTQTLRTVRIDVHYEGKQPFLLMAEPVWRDNQVVGAVAAVIPGEALARQIEIVGLNSGEFGCLLTRQGAVIALLNEPLNGQQTTTIGGVLEDAEILEGTSKEKLLQALRSGEKGTLRIRMGAQSLNARFAPIWNEDLMLVAAMEQTILGEEQKHLWQTMLLTSLGVLVSGVLLALYLNSMQKEKRLAAEARSHELAVSDRRFRLLMSLSNAVVFEWDVEADSLIFPVGFKGIMGYAAPTGGFPQSFVEQEIVDPQDAAAFVALFTEWPAKGDKVVGEYRIKSLGGYRWFRVEGLLLRDADGDVERVVGRLQDVDVSRAKMESLRMRVRIDSGSGVYNKGATEAIIGQALEQETGQNHGFLLLDIDDFKQLNDRLGHAEGDRIIRRIADLIKESLRSTDLVGRIGGDEFAIFIRDIPGELFVASKTREILEKIGTELSVGVSIGIALCPDHGTSFQDLYQAADLAMYRVKSRGKSGYSFFTEIAASPEGEDGSEQIGMFASERPADDGSEFPDEEQGGGDLDRIPGEEGDDA